MKEPSESSSSDSYHLLAKSDLLYWRANGTTNLVKWMTLFLQAVECMGREKKRSQNLDFLRLANFFLRLRGAKSQKSFATTPFLRLQNANSL